MHDDLLIAIVKRLFATADSIRDATRLTGAERQALICARERGWITTNYVLTPKGHAVVRRVLVEA